jgi:hypothetical protein
VILLAIDPGPTESAYVVYDAAVARPLAWDKADNESVKDIIQGRAVPLVRGSEALAARHDRVAIEMVASYGMAVGAEVFETVLWTGIFSEASRGRCGAYPQRVYRRAVKLHICGSSRAKDANVRQAIIDRYGPGKERAIGLKASPGPLYGMTGDCWAALAVAITAAEVAAHKIRCPEDDCDRDLIVYTPIPITYS